MKNKEQLVYDLKMSMLIILFLEYFVCLLVGGGILIYVLCINNIKDQIMMWTVKASVGAATCMCSIQYIKKIYKACIYERINIINEKKNLKVIGNFVYFLTRPLFAVVFAIVFIFSFKAGFITVFEVKNFEGNDRFLFFCTFISGIIGFSVGKVLDFFGNITIDNFMITGEKENGE